MATESNDPNPLHTVALTQEARVYGEPGITDQVAEAVTSRLTTPWRAEESTLHNFHLDGRPPAPFGATPEHKVFVRELRDNPGVARIVARPIEAEAHNELLAEFLETYGYPAAEQLGARIEVSPATIVVPEEHRLEPFDIDGVGQFVADYSVSWMPGRGWQIPVPGQELKFVHLGYAGPPVSVPLFGGMPVRMIITETPTSDLERELIGKAIRTLAGLPADFMDDVAPHVFEYYSDMTRGYDEEFESLGIGVVAEAARVWDQVTFRGELRISTSMGDSDPYRHPNAVYLEAECECTWEQEHGLQIVFLNGERVCKVSQCDGSPTNASSDDPSRIDMVYYSWN